MIIDLKNIESIEQLHEMFSKDLDFPGWYGMNWNAFWDAITGLVEMPAKLTLSGWDEFSTRFPEDSQILTEIIDDYNKEFVNKRIDKK